MKQPEPQSEEMTMDAYEKAIEALLAKVADAKDSTEAARLAEVAINLSHAAVAMAALKDKSSDEATVGGAGE